MPALTYSNAVGLGGNQAMQKAIVQVAMMPDHVQNQVVETLRNYPGVLQEVLDEQEPMLSGGVSGLAGLGFTPASYYGASQAAAAGSGSMGGLFKNLGNFFEKVYKGAVKGVRQVGAIAAPFVSAVAPGAGAILSAATAAAQAGQWQGMGPPPPPQMMQIPNIYGGVSSSIVPPWLLNPPPTQPAVAAADGGMDKNLLLLGGLALVLMMLK